MARIRTVKPELFKHEILFDMEQEDGICYRMVFAGLFTVCDREGRFKWRPRTIKAEAFPHDSFDMSRVLDALLTRGFLVQYRVSNECFGMIPSWKTHQYINNRESASSLPKPESNQVLDASSTREPREANAKRTRVVKEGKGKELNTPREKSAGDSSIFSEVKDKIFTYYRSKNSVDPEWNGMESKQLSELLKANPVAGIEHWKECLRGRYSSDVNHADRPGLWLAKLSSFRKPLNNFNRPKEEETRPTTIAEKRARL